MRIRNILNNIKVKNSSTGYQKSCDFRLYFSCLSPSVTLKLYWI